jgi:plastocyanin
MTRVALTLAVVLALVAAGCGGGDGGGSTSTGTGSSGATSAPASSPAKSSSGPIMIKMQNIQFVPNQETAKVGQKVTWTNDDTVDHNVIATSGANFKSGNFGKGGTYTFRPKKAGKIAYVCTIHPGMDGTLTVTK